MQHIGIGKATRIASIEVKWPTSRTVQEFNNVPANQFIEIKEFAKTYEKRSTRRITWKDAGGANRHMHQKP
jgi:hypothetical protein